MKEIVEKILSEQTALRSLPQTLAEVLRIVRDENSSAQELADVLIKDPALTAKVLRIVNSPFYGIGREISSMHQAVITIGMRQVTALALSSSVYNLTKKWDGGLDQVRFWRHSLEVAIASRMLAETIGFKRTEDAFIAGLLHDIGLLVLEKSFPKQCHRILKDLEHGESRIDLEEELWSTNHARVGQFMLEQWHIPDAVCTAVGHHHDVFASGATNPDMELSQIVALGNMLSRFSIYKDEPEQRVFESENRAVMSENLELTQQKLSVVERQLFSRTMDEAKYLEIEIGSSDDLLREANQMLFDQYLAVEDLLRENRKLQRELSRDRMKRVAGESLQEIAIAINQHISEATGSILSRAQSVQSSLRTGTPGVASEDTVMSMQVIIDGVELIGTVMKDLTNLACLESDSEPDNGRVMDIEERIKDQLEKFKTFEPAY